MKIEFRSIKIVTAMSEETTAYTATVYVDGKRAFSASNTGHGGADLFRAIGSVALADVDAWLAANEKPCEITGLPFGLEAFAARELDRHALRQWLKSKLRRKVMAISADNKVHSFKPAPTPEMIALFLKTKPEFRLLNGYPDRMEEAVEIMRGAVA